MMSTASPPRGLLVPGIHVGGLHPPDALMGISAYVVPAGPIRWPAATSGCLALNRGRSKPAFLRTLVSAYQEQPAHRCCAAGGRPARMPVRRSSHPEISNESSEAAFCRDSVPERGERCYIPWYLDEHLVRLASPAAGTAQLPYGPWRAGHVSPGLARCVAGGTTGSRFAFEPGP